MALESKACNWQGMMSDSAQGSSSPTKQEARNFFGLGRCAGTGRGACTLPIRTASSSWLRREKTRSRVGWRSQSPSTSPPLASLRDVKPDPHGSEALCKKLKEAQGKWMYSESVCSSWFFPTCPGAFLKTRQKCRTIMDCDSEAAETEHVHVDRKTSCSLQYAPFKRIF